MPRYNVHTVGYAGLDWAVAQSLGLKAPATIVCPTCHGEGTTTVYGYGTIYENCTCTRCLGNCETPMPHGHRWWPAYSSDWAATGALLQEYGINLRCLGKGSRWVAQMDNAIQVTLWNPVRRVYSYCMAYDPDPRAAVLRSLLLSRVGDEVTIPDNIPLEYACQSAAS